MSTEFSFKLSFDDFDRVHPPCPRAIRTMNIDQIRNLGVEIGLLGMKGLSVNDPTKTYTIKAMECQFTGLQLISIMYTAFQQFAPQQDVGMDFRKEYQAAVNLRM